MDMKIAYKFDHNGFYVEDVILSDNEGIPSNCTNIKPQDGLYKPQFVNGSWVEGMAQADILAASKATKKASLSQQCGQAITAGFSSSALGAAHTYPSDSEAQDNINSELHMFNIDPNYTSLFKTLDAGYLPHTKAQLLQVFSDGHAFKVQQLAKLNGPNGLKAQVDAATTQAQSDAITW